MYHSEGRYLVDGLAGVGGISSHNEKVGKRRCAGTLQEVLNHFV